MLHALLTAGLLASAAVAQTPQTAILTISTSHGGAGSDITNTTVTIPLNTPYTGSNNNSALSAVSYLYLTGATGVPFDSVTCQAYQDRSATETGGNPFNSTTPAFLSLNTVQVGSIVCTTNFVNTAPPGGNFSTSLLATSASSSTGNLSSPAPTTSRSSETGPMTSVYVTTMSATGGGSTRQSTVTSVVVPDETSPPAANPTDDSGSSGQGQQSETTSASAGLSTPNAGPGGREVGAEVYAGLAVVGLGVAFVM